MDTLLTNRYLQKFGKILGYEPPGNSGLEKLSAPLLDKVFSRVTLEELNVLRSVSKTLKHYVDERNLKEFAEVHASVKQLREKVDKQIMPTLSRRPSKRPSEHPLNQYFNALENLDEQMENVWSEYLYIDTCFRGQPMFFGLFIDACRVCCVAILCKVRINRSGIGRGGVIATTPLIFGSYYYGRMPEEVDVRTLHQKLIKHLRSEIIPMNCRRYGWNAGSIYLGCKHQAKSSSIQPLSTLRTLLVSYNYPLGENTPRRLPRKVLDKILGNLSLEELNVLRLVSKPLKRYVEKRNAKEFTDVYADVGRTIVEIRRKIMPTSQRPRYLLYAERLRNTELASASSIPTSFFHSANPGSSSSSTHPLERDLELAKQLDTQMADVLSKLHHINERIRPCPMYFGRYIDACRALCAVIRRRGIESDTILAVPPQHANSKKRLPEEVEVSDLYEMLTKHRENELIPMLCQRNGWNIRQDEYGIKNYYRQPSWMLLHGPALSNACRIISMLLGLSIMVLILIDSRRNAHEKATSASALNATNSTSH